MTVTAPPTVSVADLAGQRFKVLTLHQPWASLVALGVKHIETRSWTAAYRGPLAIAAAARPVRDPTFVGEYKVRGFGRFGRALVGPGLPEFRSTPRLEGYVLPRGDIVAVCDLAAIVPMKNITDPEVNCLRPPPDSPVLWFDVHPDLDEVGVWPTVVTLGGQADDAGLWETEHYGYVDVSGQLAYGDFKPGRFAWLLDGVRALDRPVPFKGRQGLAATWEP